MNKLTILLVGLIAVLAGVVVHQRRSPERQTTPEELLLSNPDPRVRELWDEQTLPADFHQRWKERPYVPDGRLFERKWFGIKTLQHPYDLWVTQEIIYAVKPDIIVETGSYQGGSAALWAAILEHANPKGKVVSIDIENVHQKALKLPVVQRRVEFLVGGSTDPEIVAEVAKRVQEKSVLVILDSLHDKEHVAGELEAYARFVPVGSYVIVQDTHLGDTVPFWWYEPEDWWRPGPLEAVREFVAADDRFIIDESREKFASTNNRSGWLKRVR